MKHCLDDKLECVHFHELKEKEFFIFFRAYYSKEELVTFFYPLWSPDTDYKDFVLTHCLRVADSNEFAALAYMSIDTFKRRFKQTFGKSPDKWMTDKSFSDIALEYPLSSQS